MIVILPVHSSDLHAALANVEHAIALEGGQTAPFRCFILRENTLDVTALAETCKRLFDHVGDISILPWAGDQRRPVPQNYMWQSAARWVEAQGWSKAPRPNFDHWFWWEPDAVPLSKGWLERLADAHADGKRAISAAVAHQPSMGHYPAGVAIWPPNPSSVCPNAMMARANCFDIASQQLDHVLDRDYVHDISALICHTPDVPNTHFTSREDAARLIPESAVLFHKCKDLSLVDVLNGKNPAPGTPGSRSQPSIHAQAEKRGWQSGLFAFPYEQGVVHFNPSLVRREDGELLLITRRSKQIKGGTHSDLTIWRVREPSMTVYGMVAPKLPVRSAGEQWEDPKAFYLNGKLHLACANWTHHEKAPIKQGLLALSDDLKVATRVPLAQGPDLTRHEKNWCPFVTAKGLEFVYSINPHTLLGAKAGSAIPLAWSYGEPRGGTPPVQVRGEYISFFHSSVPWMKPLRRYYIGCYAFSAKPPYQLTRFTVEPLLIGSEEDSRVLGGPLCVFVNGAVLTDQTWTLVMGVNDENCAFLRIPHSDIERMLVPVELHPELLSKE